MRRAADQLAQAVEAFGRGDITKADLGQELAFFEAARDQEPDTFAAIRTRDAGPTNTKGSRVIVRDDPWGDEKPRRLTWSWDHALTSQENHKRAAQAWLDKFNPFDATIDGPGLAFEGDYYWTWRTK